MPGIIYFLNDSIDLRRNMIKWASFHRRASAPPSPAVGQFYFNTTNSVPYIWTGTDWFAMGGDIGPQGPQGPQGEVGPRGFTGEGGLLGQFQYEFNVGGSSTPGTGIVTTDDADPADITTFRFGVGDANGVDPAELVSIITAGSGLLIFNDTNDEYTLYSITSATLDGGNRLLLSVSYVDGDNTTLVDLDALYVTLIIRGPQGAQGSQGAQGAQGSQGAQGITYVPATFVLAQDGPAAVATDVTNSLVMPRDGTIVKGFIVAKTAPVGASLIVDINKNNTSIWDVTPANRLKLTTGSTSGTVTSFDTTALTEGDILTIDIDQVGSGTPGEDITVVLLISVP